MVSFLQTCKKFSWKYLHEKSTKNKNYTRKADHKLHITPRNHDNNSTHYHHTAIHPQREVMVAVSQLSVLLYIQCLPCLPAPWPARCHVAQVPKPDTSAEPTRHEDLMKTHENVSLVGNNAGQSVSGRPRALRSCYTIARPLTTSLSTIPPCLRFPFTSSTMSLAQTSHLTPFHLSYAGSVYKGSYYDLHLP